MGDLLRASTAVNGSTKFSEPYRATKLWLEAVAIFRRGVPLGRHRKQWKTYENCFAAQEAITWYQSQLQVAFDPAITRKQTWTLLQKFYKANIITEVARVVSQGGSPVEINETDFKDNGNLYKLVCPTTPNSVRRKKSQQRTSITKNAETPPKRNSPPVTSHNNQYDIVIKPLTLDQIHCIWEQAFIDKFVNVVGCDVFTSFFTPGIIKGSVIAYNLTQTGLHNIVLPVEKTEDLPHWLVSAMKCLSNWPNNHTQESGVPSYPGFENDVYKLISDYFLQFQNKSPLLTYALYDAFITCFIRAELFDFNSRLYSAKISNASRTRLFQQMTGSHQQPQQLINNKQVSFAPSPMFKMEDQYPFNASESVEDLILDILTPSTQRHRKWKQPGDSMGKQRFNPRKNLFSGGNAKCSSAGNSNNYMTTEQISMNPGLREANGQTSQSSVNSFTVPVPQPMSPQIYDVNRYTTMPLYYETAFTGNETPITRVVSRTELKASLGNRQNKSTTSLKVRQPSASADAILDSNIYSNYSNNFGNNENYSSNFGNNENYSNNFGNNGNQSSNLGNNGNYPNNQGNTEKYSTKNSLQATYAYENPNLELSASDLINHPKYSKVPRVLKSTELLTESPNVASRSFWEFPGGQVPEQRTRSYSQSPPTVRTDDGKNNNGAISSSLLDDKFSGLPLRAYSAVNLTDMSKIKERHLMSSTLPAGASAGGRVGNLGVKSPSPWTPARNSLTAHYANSPSLMTSDGKRLAIISFRLLTLLLPPVNRRHLQILLRFMAKTSRNDKLMLDVAASTRAVIINTFFRTILKSEDPDEYDELLALRIATFLMDNDQEIFDVTEDKDIGSNAQEKISEQQVVKVPTEVVFQRSKSSPSLQSESSSKGKKPPSSTGGSPLSDNYVFAEANKENSTEVQFCSRISMNEYDDQRLLSGTSKSLRDLLESWINDDKLDEKEKRKQIMKFKNEYPHIFWEKFGEELPSFLNESKPGKSKKEKKTWNVFKALRI